MSFGEHIEELRVRLILALLGLFVGVIVVFIPPLDIGWRVMKKMEEPAKTALDAFYREEYDKKAKQAEVEKEKSPELQAVVDAGTFVTELKKIRPEAGSARRRIAARAKARICPCSSSRPE